MSELKLKLWCWVFIILHPFLVSTWIRGYLKMMLYLRKRNYIQTVYEFMEVYDYYSTWAQAEFYNLDFEDFFNKHSDIEVFKTWFITKVWAA